MAQVNIQKLQGGGAVKKYGNFTKDGVTYQVDDDFLQAMTAHGSSIVDDRARADYGAIVNALRSGADLSYDSNTNELRGDVTFDNINDRQRRRAARRTSKTGEALDSIFNGRVNQVKSATNALREFNYNQVTPQANKNKSVDVSRKLFLSYKRDKDGNLVLDDNGRRIYNTDIDNTSIFDRLDFLRNLEKEENIVDWKGYNNQTKDVYSRFVKEYTDWDGLYQRIKDGSITDSDINTLSKLGILDKTNTSKVKSEDAVIEKAYTKAELDPKNTYLKDLNLKMNADGTYSLGEGVDASGLFGSGNLYINDNWLDSHHEYEPLKGWFWYNNRLVPKSVAEDTNSVFYKNLAAWRYNNTNNNYGTENIGVWGNSSDPFTTYDSSKFFIPGLRDDKSNIRFRTVRNPEDPDNLIFEYYNKDSARDIHGFVTPEGINRIQYNTKTGETTKLDPLSGISSNYEPIQNYIKEYSERAPGYYESVVSDNDGNSITLYRNPYDNKDVWFFKEGMNQPYKLAPQEVDELVSQGLIPENAQLFNNVFGGSLNRDLVDELQSNRPNYRGQTGWGKAIDYLSLFGGISSLIRRAYTTKTPEVNGQPWNRTPQNIFIPKHQSGGRINYGKVENKNIDSSIKANKVGDSSKAASNAEVASGDLTKADKLQIASIAGDVAALVAAIPTGGNPVAGAIGYGSSLAQFGADVSRDGFQFGDLGSLALNLGLDTISLLPGVGIAGKLGKTAKLVKNSAKVLKKALMLAGASRAVGAVGNIAAGKGTLDDWKALSTGLFAIKGIKNEVQGLTMTKYNGKAPKVTKAETESTGKLGKLTNKAKGVIEDINSNTFSGSYNPFSKNFRWRMSNRSLPKDFKLSELNGNTSKLRTLGRLIGENPNIAQEVQSKGWVLPEQLRWNSNHEGNWFYRSPVFTRTPTFTPPKSRILLPKFAGVWEELPNNGGLVYRPQKLFKKGGKILKAHGGSKFFGKPMDNQGAYGSFDSEPAIVSAWETGVITPWQAQKEAWQRLMAEKITGIDPKTMFKTPSSPQLFLGRNQFKPIENQVPLNVQYNRTQRENAYLDLKNPYRNISTFSLKEEVSKPESSNNTASNNVVSTGSASDGRGFSFNPKNLLDLGSLVGGLISNARQRRELARGIRAAAQGQLRSMPTEIYAPYTDMGIARMYGDRIKDIRQFKTVTSDPNQVMAERLMRDQQADQLANERDIRLSQTISEFNDKDLAARREYANQRTQIADYNKAVLGQMENMLAQNKAAKQFTAWNKLINPFIDQKRMDLVRDQQDEQLATTVRDNIALQQNALKTYLELFNSTKAQKDWENEQLTNPNWQSEYGDSEAGRQKFLEKYYSGSIQNLQNDMMMRSRLNSYLNSRSRFTGRRRTIDMPQSTIGNYYRNPSFYRTIPVIKKKGGTITKTQRYRNFDEQAILDKAKDYRKAVQKMDDNLIKLLLKMLS